MDQPPRCLRVGINVTIASHNDLLVVLYHRAATGAPFASTHTAGSWQSLINLSNLTFMQAKIVLCKHDKKVVPGGQHVSHEFQPHWPPH
jgi:hypothetical protein